MDQVGSIYEVMICFRPSRISTVALWKHLVNVWLPRINLLEMKCVTSGETCVTKFKLDVIAVFVYEVASLGNEIIWSFDDPSFNL